MSLDEARICAVCQVLCVPAGPAPVTPGRPPLPGPPPQRWIHPPEAIARWERSVCDHPRPQRRPNNRELERMRGQAIRKDDWMLRGQLAMPELAPGDPVELGVVGCYAPTTKETPPWHPMGWGYLSSAGHYGAGAAVAPKHLIGDRELDAESRALFWGMRAVFPREAHPVTVVTDYEEIADLLAAWQGGDVTRMPPGYQIDRPASGRQSKLSMLAETVADYPELLQVRLVEDYEDTPLGAGADRLSRLGWHWAIADYDKPAARDRALALAAETLQVEPVLREQRRGGDSD